MAIPAYAGMTVRFESTLDPLTSFEDDKLNAKMTRTCKEIHDQVGNDNARTTIA